MNRIHNDAGYAGPPSLGCLNRATGLGLALLSLTWVVYLAFTPLDPAWPAIDQAFRRLATAGLGLAWCVFLVTFGLGTIVTRWQDRARRRRRRDSGSWSLWA